MSRPFSAFAHWHAAAPTATPEMTEPTEPENRKGFFPGSGIRFSALIQGYANSRSRELGYEK
ncbi:MAG: hypothetical protein DME80_10660 [Verrucomicrobia bacterium]|nr:MAG: hypothetical protein DME80_10660 [Verrucomicrobiota bacterium]